MNTYLIVDTSSDRTICVAVAETESLALKAYYMEVGPPLVEELQAVPAWVVTHGPWR